MTPSDTACKAKRETQIIDGVFTATWALRVPWAHPFWPEYMLLLYDLRSPSNGGPPVIYLPGATHEFLLYAIDPDTPWDFERSLYDQKKIAPLTPANLGYQFIATSDHAATDRLDKCVTDIMDAKLSPDTDYRRLWDELFRDGKSLLKSGLDTTGLTSLVSRH